MNKILIPFIFFYLFSYAIFYGIKVFFPSLLLTDAKGIFDLFDNRQFFNGPIWFLLCLFWCNLMFCAIHLYIRNDWGRVALAIIIGALGYWLGEEKIFVPLFIDVAFTAFPFFVFGYYLKRSQILYPNKFDKFNIIIAIVFWGISFIMTRNFEYQFHPHYNEIHGWATYVIAIVSVLSILMVCKAIKYIPVVTYMGRYSIILLCTHHLIYRPLKVACSFFMEDVPSILIALLTLALSTLMIPICKRWIPWFVAQKDLIKTNF